MTAVEWLKNNIPSLFIDDSGHYKELFQQALIMEKEQIIDAYLKDRPKAKIEKVLTYWDKAEQYYNETFFNKVD
jgi:hypothetical protein